MAQFTAKNLLIFYIISSLIITLLSSCGKPLEKHMEQSFLLDTVVSINYYDEADREAVDGAMELCREYELIFSRTNPQSELFRLNQMDSMEVSDALLTVLRTTLDYCNISDGRFDITMGGVSELYGFSEAQPSCPDTTQLEDALSHVNYNSVSINDHHVTLHDSATVLDLGAAAKGYIADEMKNYLLRHGVEHAIISLGGNVVTLGGRPDDSDFVIGIQYPEKESTQLVSSVAVSEGSVVTSGVYERFFTENGITYHHILDSRTGKPINNGLLAVSIVGPSSLHCDILSTVCFVLGSEQGLALIESMEGYEALFVTADNSQIVSSGFEKLQP